MTFLDTFVKNNKVLELCKFCSKWVQLIKLGAVLKKFCSLQFPSQKFKNRNGIWKWTIHNLKWFQFKTQSFFYFFRLYKGYLLPDGTTNNCWFLRHNGRKNQKGTFLWTSGCHTSLLYMWEGVVILGWKGVFLKYAYYEFSFSYTFI